MKIYFFFSVTFSKFLADIENAISFNFQVPSNSVIKPLVQKEMVRMILYVYF